ncbi:hypothetical protein GF359_02760 [candidate division WOR-3 bacterium]|uniref:OsmC family peroxiredoxin n=1 Tax=candidate division WOR-3 bacterium TaxID=2052148 RepID=A0A9D5K8N4_UNCW3|nr:hypothetical protein [candidate division WOR-3 bacterium]MBD3364115.1 hypothetical protein [candidate division WOR-3 bacterium]
MGSVKRVSIRRLDGLTLAAKGDSGHWITLDTAKKLEGNEGAPAPMELLLTSLGGCTGMDVLSILKKMKQPVKDFCIELEGKQSAEHPRVYTRIDIVFIVEGDVEPAKLERAIELSQERYCPVTAMLKPTVDIRTNYRVETDGSTINTND